MPADECYILKPPYKCPITPLKTYFKLIKILYGLKRSPCHWFQLATKIFNQLGLHSCPNSPCLFTGSIAGVDGRIYLGLYVDDFIFFGDNDAVEEAFRNKLEAQCLVTFEYNPTHFLGNKITTAKDSSGHYSSHLSQKAVIDDLLEEHHLHETTNTTRTPYRSGFPVAKIDETRPFPRSVKEKATKDM